MRVVPILLVSSAAGLTAAAMIAVYAFIKAPEGSVTPLIAAAGFCAASAGWLLTNALTLHVKLREKAYEYVQHAIVDDKLTTPLKSINDAWRSPDFVNILETSAALQSHFVENELAGEPYNSIQFALNFFNYIGILVYRGAIDEKLVRDYYEGMIDRLYPRISALLPLFRNNPPVPGHRWELTSRKEIGFHFEWLAKRWSGRLERRRQLEEITGRWKRLRFRCSRLLGSVRRREIAREINPAPQISPQDPSS